MPIYEYRCRKCDSKFELLRGISASDEDIECPECGEKAAERIFSVFSGKSSGADCGPGSSSGST